MSSLQPRTFRLNPSVLSALDGATISTECQWWAPDAPTDWMVEARRFYSLGAHATAALVPMPLRLQYVSWVDAAISARGGVYAIARGDHFHLHQFLCTHALQLPNARTIMERLNAWRPEEAADLFACLASGGLLREKPPMAGCTNGATVSSSPTRLGTWFHESLEALGLSPSRRGSAVRAANTASRELQAWLDSALVEYDARLRMHDLATQGDIDALARHLEQRPCGFSIDEQLPITDHPTLLYVAASNGNTAVVRLLIERRADVNATSCGGWTALHGAASCLQSAQTVAMLLLGETANVHAASGVEGQTPLHVAAKHGRLGAATLLVARGADPGARDHDGDTPLDIVNRMTQMDPCCGGETADRQFGALSVFFGRVQHATAEGRLLESTRSWDLTVAATLQDMIGAKSYTPNVFRELLNCFEPHLDARDYDGTSALHAAAHAGNLDAACALLDRQPELIHSTTSYSETPLHLAAKEDRLEMVRLLVARGSDVSSASRSKMTPVDLARRRGDSEGVVEYLEAARLQTLQ